MEHSNSQSQITWWCRFYAMINAPLSQSLSRTRATLPVWYTSSQIESTPFSSYFWCNRAPYGAPVLFSFPAIKCCAWSCIISGSQNSFGAFGVNAFISMAPRKGYNDQSLWAAGRAQFAAAPSVLTHHSAWHPAYHCSGQLYDPVKRVGLHSLPVLCQINTRLMTLLSPFFQLN